MSTDMAVHLNPILACAQVRYTAFDERALDMLMGRHAGTADVSADGEDGQQQQQVHIYNYDMASTHQ